jgi:hypothetical protein
MYLDVFVNEIHPYLDKMEPIIEPEGVVYCVKILNI